MAKSGSGLIVTNTNRIRSFLLCDTSDPDANLPPELRNLASTLSSQSIVPYKSLRSIWSALPAGSRPALTGILEGSEFVFTSPKPREKSEELKARLRKLEELSERKAYAELVKDIAPKKGTDEPFSSYKDQIGFSLLLFSFVFAPLADSCRICDTPTIRIHVVLIMFTGYLVGYYCFRALFNHSMNAAGGIIGLVCGMLVETHIFIIKTSNQDTKSAASTSRPKKKL